MSLIGKTVEEQMWNFFMERVGNAYGVAALIGHWFAESGLNPKNLQDSFEGKLGHTNESYTAAVDNGCYENFARDSAGYGLAQWTHWSRKQDMLNFARARGCSIGDTEMQFEFGYQELCTGYKAVLSVMRSAKSVREASDVLLTQYERPADQGEAVKVKRAGYGQKYYEKYSGNRTDEKKGECNMSIMVGSARIDENGNISGGKAGDQTRQEVATQNWYLHSKGWVVIRAKRAEVAEAIARNMQAGCDNDHIGYCQAHRTSATAAVKKYGYDLSKVTKDCEVDCSELVRICCLYAGITVKTFNTASEISALKATGEFDILTENKYCKSSDYLLRGDILVTKAKGHTVVVLNNGAKAEAGQQPALQSPRKVVAALYKDPALAGAYKTTTDLNMRFKQGVITQDNVACVIPAGKSVKCYGFYNIVSGVKWYLVAYGGKEGYVSSKYLKRS